MNIFCGCFLRKLDDICHHVTRVTQITCKLKQFMTILFHFNYRVVAF